MWVTGFFVLGHFFYYCLILVANRQLSSADFGRFYTGWTLLNIIVTPGAIVTLLLAAHFGRAFRQGEKALLAKAMIGAARQLVIPTLIIVALLELSVEIAGAAFGIDSALLGILVPLVALATFMVEVLRATFQGSMQFTRYGAYWTLWCALQLGLGACGVLWFKAPWAVFAGMLTASILVFGWLIRTVLPAAPDTATPSNVGRLTFDQFFPFCSALLGAVIFVNADILVSYLSFSPAVHGSYAASAFLTKAIVTATQPVLQIMIPVIVHMENLPLARRVVMWKALGLGAGLAFSGAIFLWLFAGQVCGGRYGIRYCDVSIMKLLALSAIPLTVVRVWAVADVTHKRYAIAQLAYPAVAIFAFLASKGGYDALSLAVVYCLTCWGLLAVRASLQLLGTRRIEETL